MNTDRSSLGLKLLAGVLALLFITSLAMLNYGNYQAGSVPWELALSALLLAVPLGMFYFSLWVLAAASLQKHQASGISRRLSAIIYWTPRIAGILIVVFVGLFALDVFDGQASIWMMIGAFLIHALPALLMGAFVALAWRKPAVGFVGFLLAALFFLRVLINDSFLQAIGSALLFSGPMAAIAALFWANWRWHIQRAQPGEAHPGQPDLMRSTRRG